MTTATLLLALLTASNPSSNGGPSEPILLDFHAQWCGPCRQMRPAVDQLARKGYPIKSIDIDRSPALAERYGVQAVPTFIVVDSSGREISRTSGAQPAGVLERFYATARSRVQPPARSNDIDSPPAAEGDDDRTTATAAVDTGGEPAEDRRPPVRPVRRARHQQEERDEARAPGDDSQDGRSVERDGEDTARQDESRPAQPFKNPHPARTVVRIQVISPHSTGFGSGTIIYSSPEETIVLTCAHIFHMEGRVKEVPASQFPLRIMIDLFDGQLHQQLKGPPKVDYVESFPGKAMDYDFMRDVGLIRFRPGRQLPASRVVPTYWQPKSDPLPMKMLTVGCSEGQDATAWHTRIMNPRMKGFLQGKPAYEAIECEFAPKQGRSGGGLFTTNGYIAGVCNFAEPQGNHGLYATPRSIYTILDRNGLSALYAPAVQGQDGMLLADGRKPVRPGTPPRLPSDVTRLQSRDGDESQPRRAVADRDDVLLPHYSLLGIKNPVGSDGDSASPRPRTAARTASGTTTRRIAWQQTPSAPAGDGASLAEPAPQTDKSAAPAQVEPPAAAPPVDRTGTSSSSRRPRWRTADSATAEETVPQDR